MVRTEYKEEVSVVSGNGFDERRFAERIRPGIHAVSYYYSEEHLLVKGAQWISQGIQSGEKCFFNLNPALHEQFLSLLEKLGVNVTEVREAGQLQVFPFQEMYQVYCSNGIRELVPMVKEMLWKTWEEGFTNTRILGEANYGIWRVDPEQGFQWEAAFDQIALQLPLKALCLYELQDLLQVIQTDASFIHSTLCTHQYIYNGGQTISSTDFFNQVLERAN